MNLLLNAKRSTQNAKGELSGILSSIRLLAKIIHRDINKAGLTNILGQSGRKRAR